jgi:hypothetical protein
VAATGAVRRSLAWTVCGIAALASACGATPPPPHVAGPNPVSLGFIDRPRPHTSVSSLFPVEGWAADESGVAEVRIFLDGRLAATVPTTASRPDVDAAFPQVARERHGFSLELDAGGTTGPCTVRADVVDRRGAVTTVAQVTIVIEP